MFSRLKCTLIATIVVAGSLLMPAPAVAELCDPDTNSTVGDGRYACGPGQLMLTTCYYCIGQKTGTIYQIGDCDHTCLYVA